MHTDDTRSVLTESTEMIYKNELNRDIQKYYGIYLVSARVVTNGAH